tara:strand:- start:776 stop:967 length:192 start_codon:yes stop_codon:yes gene_type:complete
MARLRLTLMSMALTKGCQHGAWFFRGATPYEVLLGQRPVLASVRDGQVLVRREASHPETGLML